MSHRTVSSPPPDATPRAAPEPRAAEGQPRRLTLELLLSAVPFPASTS